jgi:hypothetical protein
VLLIFEKVCSIVHLLIQLPLDCGDLPQTVAHEIVEKALNGVIAHELQAVGIKLSRTTLAEDPHVTKKNVFKGSGEDMAREPDFGDKRPLTSGTAATSSSHTSEKSEASALQPSTPSEQALYKRNTDDELNVMANQTVYMQMLSNRDLASALRCVCVLVCMSVSLCVSCMYTLY